MALEPKLTDYVSVIMQLFEQFMQHRIDKQGVTPAKSLTYSTCSFIIFFMLMQFRGIYGFKTQWRWLINHPEVLPMLGWQQPPHRTTIARRYKALYEVRTYAVERSTPVVRCLITGQYDSRRPMNRATTINPTQ